MFIDPEGRVIGKHEGEAPADALAEVVRAVIEEYELREAISRAPISAIQPMPHPEGPLVYPGKVLADVAGGRLFIADSGNNRIVVAALDGTNAWTIGQGDAGLADGDAASARFHHPQGLALDASGETLYVADTGNHAVRQIDLRTRAVSTVAGTGRLGRAVIPPGPARSADLRSPWDLVALDGVLSIAMAGTHQLFALDLAGGTLRRYAGTGHEGIRDETLERAWFAQPSGLATDGTALYAADSETSAVRIVGLPPLDMGMVETVVGTGLFDFGDIDGIGQRARLQHPMGVAASASMPFIYVADSYNHKIKRIDLATERVESWLGDGEPGFVDGIGAEARFNEPEGVSIGGDRLYIADTNNHVIRVADLETGTVSTLRIDLPT
jgi:DNA-binding beta-propeller fold protein YncE